MLTCVTGEVIEEWHLHSQGRPSSAIPYVSNIAVCFAVLRAAGWAGGRAGAPAAGAAPMVRPHVEGAQARRGPHDLGGVGKVQRRLHLLDMGALPGHRAADDVLEAEAKVSHSKLGPGDRRERRRGHRLGCQELGLTARLDEAETLYTVPRRASGLLSRKGG